MTSLKMPQIGSGLARLSAGIKKRPVLFTVLAYVLIRVASFFTYAHGEPTTLLNQAIGAALLMGFAYLCVKKPALAWMALLFELLIGGAGHFFSVEPFILRTWMLGIFGISWIIWLIKQKRLPELKCTAPYIWLGAFSAVLVYAAINGLWFNHQLKHILQDVILYAFVFLAFPAKEYLQETRQMLPFILKGFTIGSALQSLFTFTYYSSGAGRLNDSYYHWVRNIAGGKVTDLGSGFFRIVYPEHLFVLLLMIVFTALVIKQKDKSYWIYIFAGSLVLAMNFTRIYYLALAIGFAVLLFQKIWKRALFVSAVSGLSVILCFSALFAMGSGGAGFGANLFLGRSAGIVSPEQELSGATRLALLPDIKEQFFHAPTLGSGLGATVSYTDPLDDQQKSRTQFDWGYFEQVVELGMLGFTIFLFFLMAILLALLKKMKESKAPLLHGLLAGAASLFVVNITTPALFYGFGMLFFALVWQVADEERI